MQQSILERIIGEVDNLEFRSPFRDVVNLDNLPNGLLDIVQRAIELLDDSKDIQTFRDELVAYISSDARYKKEDAFQLANSSIGYATGYYDDMKANIWFDALSDISHPIMGRQRPFLAGKNPIGFYLSVETDDSYLKAYLRKEFTNIGGEENSFFPEYTVTINELDAQDGISGRIIAHLSPKSRGYLINNGGDHYMFLSGVCMGLELKTKEEIGKECRIKIDMIERNTTAQ